MLFALDFKQTPPPKEMSDKGQSSVSMELTPRHSGREQQEEKPTCVFTPTFGSFWRRYHHISAARLPLTCQGGHSFGEPGLKVSEHGRQTAAYYQT